MKINKIEVYFLESPRTDLSNCEPLPRIKRQRYISIHPELNAFHRSSNISMADVIAEESLNSIVEEIVHKDTGSVIEANILET